MNRSLKWLASLPACLLLCACVHLGEPRVTGPRPERSSIAGFALEGRLSVKQGDHSYQAGVQWTHEPGAEKILLTGPLGQGLAELESTAEGARLITSDQKVLAAANADALALELLGFDLPLSALPDWVLGRSHPVDGWQVQVLRYESEDANALPLLLELQRGDDLTVRIKIDEWQLP